MRREQRKFSNSILLHWLRQAFTLALYVWDASRWCTMHGHTGTHTRSERKRERLYKHSNLYSVDANLRSVVCSVRSVVFCCWCCCCCSIPNEIASIVCCLSSIQFGAFTPIQPASKIIVIIIIIVSLCARSSFGRSSCACLLAFIPIRGKHRESHIEFVSKIQCAQCQCDVLSYAHVHTSTFAHHWSMHPCTYERISPVDGICLLIFEDMPLHLQCLFVPLMHAPIAWCHGLYREQLICQIFGNTFSTDLRRNEKNDQRKRRIRIQKKNCTS